MGLEKISVGFVGAGAMGGAIACGLVNSGTIDAPSVMCSDLNKARLDELAQLGITTFDSAEELVRAGSTVVVLAVKPQVLPNVLSELAGLLEGRLVVSIAAGVTIATLEAALPGARVVRVMPNLPIQVMSGAVAITPGPSATPKDAELVQALFSAFGSAHVMSEHQLDVEGAVVSCGPAYIALVVDALTRAGIKAGLPAGVCREMVEHTMLGVAKTLIETGEHPRAYMEKITSPGGTTAAGLEVLEPYVMEGAYAAVDAALARTEELAKG